jgi:hypothetical protein
MKVFKPFLQKPWVKQSKIKNTSSYFCNTSEENTKMDKEINNINSLYASTLTASKSKTEIISV